MDAGAGALAGGVEPRHVGTPVEIGDDATHRVVGGRGDGHGLDAGVEAVLADGVDEHVEALAVDRAQVEQRGAARVDGAGDNVARRELVGEAPTVVVEQRGALAAQGLAQQQARARERGRVELHELEVGDGRACAPGHRDTLPGRAGRVGGALPEGGHATGGEQRGAGRKRPVGRERADAAAALIGPEVECADALAHRDARVLGDALGEHARDGGAGGSPVGVQDAAPRVAAFQAEPLVELDAEREQVGDAGGRLGDQCLDGAGPAEAATGAVGVLGVQGRRVVRADGGGDAALRPGAGGVEQRPLGDQHDVGVDRGDERGGHAGNAAAYDEEVCALEWAGWHG